LSVKTCRYVVSISGAPAVCAPSKGRVDALPRPYVSIYGLCICAAAFFGPPAEAPSGIVLETTEVRLHTLGRTHIEIGLISGTGIPSISIAASRDFLAAAKGGEIEIWDIRKRRRHSTLKLGVCLVRSVDFASDGEVLASGGTDTDVRIWNVNTGALRARLRGHRRDVRSVAFSPDGRLLASGDEDGIVRVWDVNKGTQRLVLRGHGEAVRSLAFSKDGRLLCSGSLDRTVRISSIPDGQTLQVLAHDK